jgi:LEA14-like dessication related protein
MPHSDPVQVAVAGVEGLPGEAMELRMLVKLRVQNPNQAPIEFTGVYLQLDVLDKTFATGVSDESGAVPGFGEAVIAVPVTVSALRMARHVVGMLDGQPVDRISYQMSGKLNGGMFNTHRFESKGEFALPKSDSAPAP